MDTMPVSDWRSHKAYANFERAEAADIAWEWLRRDNEYQSDYGSLTSEQRSSGLGESFRQKWGLSFRS
jgi:hypothetical protein